MIHAMKEWHAEPRPDYLGYRVGGNQLIIRTKCGLTATYFDFNPRTGLGAVRGLGKVWWRLDAFSIETTKESATCERCLRSRDKEKS